MVEESKLIKEIHFTLFWECAAFPGFVKDSGVRDSWLNASVANGGHETHAFWGDSRDSLPHWDTQLVGDVEESVALESFEWDSVHGDV